jgi:Putative effector of murein hydrolase LrgA
MKYLKQFFIILAVSFAGEVLKYIIPLPIPASIYGLVIMLFLLGTKILSLECVRETGLFLVEIMPVMFIPAAVGLMDAWGELKPMLLSFSVITLFVTVLVMVCGGHAVQFIIRHNRRKEAKKESDKEKVQ